MKILLIVMSIFATVANAANAEEEMIDVRTDEAMVCEIQPPKRLKKLEKLILEQGCKKGDILLIRELKMPSLFQFTPPFVCDLSEHITRYNNDLFPAFTKVW